ncbi:MAG: alpha/beta hydrolase fold protein [Frankiales bacterium]|jgi:pimeloyl-ACP methyl ester carboxylesterase|nr:alpha/beta hydrolase fold protein [Frankiales bacterium]
MSPAPSEPALRRTTVNDLDMAYLELGSGPLVVLLHGFPDTAWGWSPLMADLAGAGYRAVAPFMRGYAPTAVPADGLSPMSAWVADVLALREQLAGDEPSVVVGHDWGAFAAYGVASHAPHAWRRVVTASVPPASVMGERAGDYDQLKRFWYQYLFLQPAAEAVVAADDFAFLTRLWSDWSPGLDASAPLLAVKDALRDPANLSAALSTYRCLYDQELAGPQFADHALAVFLPHPQPTLYLHGADDGCIAADVLGPTQQALPAGSAVQLIAGAGHFLQYEQPAVVSRLVLDFLGAPA